MYMNARLTAGLHILLWDFCVVCLNSPIFALATMRTGPVNIGQMGKEQIQTIER